MRQEVPPGYVELDAPGVRAVAHQQVAGAVRDALATGTLYEWAARQPDRRALQGRVTAWAVPLPGDGLPVVVRHSYRGGLLAPLLKDLFPPPTRAPAELSISLMLRQSGVPTPPVAAYAVYPAGPLFRRSDVMTIELPGEDLISALRASPTPDRRRMYLESVAALLGALTQAGAWHPDLNMKNIFLMVDGDDAPRSAVLDVDRVVLMPPGDPQVRDANLERLARSSAKWRTRDGIGFTDEELRDLKDLVARDEAVHAAHRALAMQEFMP